MLRVNKYLDHCSTGVDFTVEAYGQHMAHAVHFTSAALVIEVQVRVVDAFVPQETTNQSNKAIGLIADHRIT